MILNRYRFWKITNFVILGFLILISILGTFFFHISFGWGLGDVIGYIMLYSTTLIHLVLTIILRKQRIIWFILLTNIFLIITIYISLKATIWRGSEYPWNGSIFYLPCPQEIKIKKGDTEKVLRITMCTMDYYSEINASWDGQFMVLKEGELKIPHKLKKYVEYPIDRFGIYPEYHARPEIEVIQHGFNFNRDTLKLNKLYNVSGEIRKINNGLPIFEVRIAEMDY